MSRLLTVLGIVFLAIGAAIAVVGFMNPGQMQVKGLTMDSAALLLLAGMVGMGFGGVIEAVARGAVGSNAGVPDDSVRIVEAVPAVVPTVVPDVVPDVQAVSVDRPEPVVAPVVTPAVADADEQPSRIRFRGFGRKLDAGTPAVAAAATAVAASSIVPAHTAVDDTINALEKAKQDITSALGGVERMSAPPPPPPPPPPPTPQVVTAAEPDFVEEAGLVEDEPVDDGELYVVEEKTIRGRPARILSDDTVEAETDEGWMRFENLEHLNEYLDAAEA